MVLVGIVHHEFCCCRSIVWRVRYVGVVLKGDRGCLSMSTISLVVELEFVV